MGVELERIPHPAPAPFRSKRHKTHSSVVYLFGHVSRVQSSAWREPGLPLEQVLIDLRSDCSADCRRPDGRGAWCREIDRLAPAC